MRRPTLLPQFIMLFYDAADFRAQGERCVLNMELLIHGAQSKVQNGTE